MNEQQIFAILLVVVCTYASWKGGAPERISAVAFLVAASGTALFTLKELHRFVRLEGSLLAIDIILLGVLLWLALCSTRWWPLVMAGIQIDDIAVHAMRIVAPETLQMAYLYGAALWSYPMLLILAAATWRHRDRVSRFGADPAWRDHERIEPRPSDG